MTEQSDDRGRGDPPAAPFLSFERLFGRAPSSRQQLRLIELQRKFALKSNDSVFIIISILELYLGEVEAACMDVRRSARRTVRRACLLAMMIVTTAVAPLYLLQPGIRSALGWAPASAEQVSLSPTRAYMRAMLDQMPDQDVDRLATSRDALIILQHLPQVSDEDLSKWSRYLQVQTPRSKH